MSNVSLTAAIRTPKVTTGLAPNLESMRRLGPDGYCPDRKLVDIYGRPAPIDSIKTHTFGGCYSSLDRILTENELRYQYSYYLPTLEGVGQSQSLPASKYNYARRDMLGNTNRDRSFGLDPTYQIFSPPKQNFMSVAKGSAGPEEQSEYEFLSDIEQRQRITNRVNMNTDYSNGGY